MTVCDHIQNQLSLYVDDALEKSARTKVDQHLKTCPACTRELNRLRNLVRTMGSVEAIPAPENFQQNLKQRLVADHPIKRAGRRLLFPLKLKLPLQLATATAVGVLIFTVVNITRVDQKSILTTQYKRPQGVTTSEDKSDRSIPKAKVSKGKADNKSLPIGGRADRGAVPKARTVEPAAAPPAPKKPPIDMDTNTAAIPEKTKKVATAKDTSAVLPETAVQKLALKEAPRPVAAAAPVSKPKNLGNAPRVKALRIERPAKSLDRVGSTERKRAAEKVVSMSMPKISLVLFGITPKPSPILETQKEATNVAPGRAMMDDNSRVLKLKTLLGRLGATDIQIHSDKTAPRTIFVESKLPAQNYARLIEGLTQVGQLRRPYPIVTVGPPQAHLRVEIQLVGP